jgi:tetratricopeptide (TPR) repeat protein
MGRILIALNRTEEAVSFFQKSIELGPRNFTARSSLIAALFDLKANPETIRSQLVDAKRSAQTPREKEIATHLEARCLFYEGRSDEAGRLLENEIAKGRKTTHNYSLLADISLAQYNRDKDSFPASAETYLGKAKFAIEEGLKLDQYDKTLTDIKSRLP